MISAVIITRNEELNIARTIYSLKSNLIDEIIVSDSNSSDHTEMIVSTLAESDDRVKFYSYHNAPFTAARGRNEGALKVSGNPGFILFLDGDMELKSGFLELALKKLFAQDNLVAVSGQMDNYFYDDNQELVKKELDIYDIDKNQPGGAFLIQRKDFEAVKGFNSELIVNEEAHLEYKINRGGHCMQRINIPMIIHHTEIPISKTRLKERLFDRKLTALGINVYEALFDFEYFRIVFKDNPYTLVSSLYVLILPLLFYIDLYFPFVVIFILYFVFALLLRNIRIPINYILYGVGVVWGCLRRFIQGKAK